MALAAALAVVPLWQQADSSGPSEWRINAGAGAVTDAQGRTWLGDHGSRGDGGIQHATGLDIVGTTDDVVYQTNRWGMHGYDVQVTEPGSYRVRLLFAETVFAEPGRRVFDVHAEGVPRVVGLDLVARAGYAVAHDETFDVDVTDGMLSIEFARIADDPMVSGVEVVRLDAAPSVTTAAPRQASAPAEAATTTSTPTPTPTTLPAATPPPPAPTPSTTSPPPPPAPASYPGPGNTGVPAGTVLTPSGSFTVTDAGAVIDGLDVTGCIQVRANDVTIRRTRVRGSCFAGAIDTGYGRFSGIVIQDVEIDGGNQEAGAALLGNSGFTCQRCNIHHGGSGIRMTSDVVIEDSWIHDLYGEGNSHNSGVGSNGGNGFVLRRNNIDCSTLPNCSGAFVLYGDFSPVTNVLAEGNLFNGGGFCVYAGSVAGKAFPAASNVRFVNNAFGRSAFANCGYYGPFTAWAPGIGSEWYGNHWVDTGQPV